MASYLERYYVYATLAGVDVDITPFTIKEIEGEWGISGIEAIDLLADSGSFKFTLNNRDGRFTPGTSGALSGWKKGVTIKFVCIYDGESYTRFRGVVDTLTFNDNDYTVTATAVDWLDYAAKFPLLTPETTVGKRSDEVISLILAEMGITPQSTLLDVGNETFSVIFDSTEKKTKAYSEFAKIANSEVGHLYLKKDKTNGETLVFENQTHRTGLDTLDSIPYLKSEDSKVLNSTSGYVLTSDGGNVLVRSHIDAYFENNMVDISTVYGQGVVNSMRVTANPKTYDSGSVVLYSLAEPLFIGAGKTVEVYGAYADVYGNKCNALTSSMINPVVTTDYLCWTKKTGTGTNISASVVVVADFGSAQAKYTITNNATKSGYLTRLTARGTGIYAYSQIEAIEEDATSYNEYGYQSLSFEQDYQTDLVVGSTLAKQIVESEKQPKLKLVDVSFIANENPFLMLAFLNCDIGSLVHIKDDRYEIDGYFYIQKMKYRVELGGIVRYTLVLRSVISLALGLTLVSCDFNNSVGDSVCYGNLPALIDLPEMSISAEIFPTSLITQEDIVSGWVDGEGGFELSTSGVTAGKIAFTQVGSGIWRTTNVVVSANTWSTITVTRTTSGVAHMFINGAEVPLDLLAPASTYASVDGMDFCIGNIHGQIANTNFTKPFKGIIRRVDVHNRILTDTEALAWSNGTTITDGLVFQGNTVKTKDLSLYSTPASQNKFFDNVYGAIGTINGSPVVTEYYPISESFSGSTAIEGLSFGVIPETLNLQTRSISAWVKTRASGTPGNVVSLGASTPYPDGARFAVIVDKPYLIQTGSTGTGQWRTTSASVSPNVWTNIIVTRDSGSSTNKPVFYVNGVTDTTYEFSAISGSLLPEVSPVIIVGIDGWSSGWFNGEVKDVRIYNTILSASSASAIASGLNVTDGLVFSAPAIKTDANLNSSTEIYDSISGNIATITGSPVRSA